MLNCAVSDVHMSVHNVVSKSAECTVSHGHFMEVTNPSRHWPWHYSCGDCKVSVYPPHCLPFRGRCRILHAAAVDEVQHTCFKSASGGHDQVVSAHFQSISCCSRENTEIWYVQLMFSNAHSFISCLGAVSIPRTNTDTPPPPP